jgi:hypothetical protein
VTDINSMVGQIVPAVGAAVGAYGVSVLTRAEAQAADATVRLGQRLLDRLLRRAPDRTPLEAAVAALASTDGHPDALAALRLQIRELLTAHPSLVTELADLLPAQPAQEAGTRGVAVAGNVSGNVSTGDSSINIQNR